MSLTGSGHNRQRPPTSNQTPESAIARAMPVLHCETKR